MLDIHVSKKSGLVSVCVCACAALGLRTPGARGLPQHGPLARSPRHEITAYHRTDAASEPTAASAFEEASGESKNESLNYCIAKIGWQNK